MSGVSGPPSNVASDRLDHLRTLVRAAFERAAASGRDDWHCMTTAVLKNRLLNLTNRTFTETEYGASSMPALMRLIPDLVQVASEGYPGRVCLTDPDALRPSPVSSTPTRAEDAGGEFDWRDWRIRDDLWQSIVHYEHGGPFVLDPVTKVARNASADDDSLPQLPTLTREEFEAWRRDFVDSIIADTNDEALKPALQVWLLGHGRTADLPRAVRGRWIENFKRRVAERLHNWFAEQGLAEPLDLLISSRAEGRLPLTQETSLRELREFVVAAIHAMDLEELKALHLPVGVLARVKR